jgi:alkylation response protein AidB-like acyl-CoA dehydrogenase
LNVNCYNSAHEARPSPAELRQQVRELTGRWRAEGRYVPRNDSWLRGFDLDFSRELAALGLIGLTWPVEYGGRGLPNVAARRGGCGRRRGGVLG